MKGINFYRQARMDGGERTGVEIDGTTVLEQFQRGGRVEDSALLWFVDVRCSGKHLPEEPEAARRWLLAKASVIQAGLLALAGELSAGIDFSTPISRDITGFGGGVSGKIVCSAVRRLSGLKIAKALEETGSLWPELLGQLEVLEPLVR
jgi:hypothetical protein